MSDLANMEEFNMAEPLVDYMPHTDVEEGDFPIPNPMGVNDFAQFIEYFRMDASSTYFLLDSHRC